MTRSSSTLSLLIADDHAMILEMFELYLQSEADLVLRTARDLPQALATLETEGPFDLVLLDLNMPGMNGMEGFKEVLARNGGRPAGILTSNPAQSVVEDVIALGGAGILLKTASMKTFVNEVRLMAGGGRYLPMELIQRRGSFEPEPEPLPTTKAHASTPLSKRELTVLALLAEGKTNREIGDDLGLAEPTIKMHVKSICTKLDVANRTQAVLAAQALHLV